MQSYRIGLLILLMWPLMHACHLNNDTPQPDVALHQELTIAYRKHVNRLSATAQFRQYGKDGKLFLLNDKYQLLFNDRNYTRITSCETEGIKYFWEAATPSENLQTVSIMLKKPNGSVFLNQLSLADTFDIDLPKNWVNVDKSAGMQIEWLGRAIQYNDMVTVQLRQGTIVSNTLIQDSVGATHIYVPLKELEKFESGSIELIIKRIRTAYGLKFCDGEAGGVSRYMVEQRRVVNIR